MKLERLFFQDNRFATAVGRTSSLSGEILVDYDNPALSRLGEIVVDVSGFRSDESRRDNFLTRNGLVTSVYPLASFTPRTIDGLPESASPGDNIFLTIHGDLTVKDVAKPVSWQVSLNLEEGRVVGFAETVILMSDFGVGPIQLAFLRTEDQVRLVFEFTAVEAAR
jgi:polyisoprenoid-binding protein YceI